MHEYVVTLFAQSLPDDRLTIVKNLLRQHGLQTVRSYWLERRDTSPAFRVHANTGAPINCSNRSAILDAAEALGVDVFLQTVEEAANVPRLFVMDMDSTLIQAEVIDELAALAGVGDVVANITERAMRGEIDFQRALRERVALLTGMEVNRLDDLQCRIQFSPGADVLMRGLKAAGCVTVVVSGGFGFFARHAQQQLGFMYLFCNELEMANGALSGRLVGPIVDADRKRTALLEVAERERLPKTQVVAIGDGANDIPMLKEAAIGIAYRAKPVVKAACRFRLSHCNLDCLLHLLDRS